MSLIKWIHPSKMANKSNWIENLLTDTNDLSRWDWDKSNDLPALNVREESDAFYLEVAAPGMKKENFKIQVDNGVLIVSGSNEEEHEEKGENYMRREFNYRNFRRSFWLPESVNPNKIEAKYEKELLNIRLLKTTPTSNGSPKVIPVK